MNELLDTFGLLAAAMLGLVPSSLGQGTVNFMTYLSSVLNADLLVVMD